MERTIRVTGKGKISVAPDITRLIITQSGVYEAYEEAVRMAADKKGELNESLSKLGFKKEDLKTLYFNINSEYEGYYDENDHYQKRFVGYKYEHALKLEFPIDNLVLGKILVAVTSGSSDPELSICYTTSDPEPIKNQLLSKAVEDSKNKAEILAKSAGVSLKDIVNIDYSWGQVEFVSRSMELTRSFSTPCLRESDGYDIDIEPDDIDVTDTVTIVWSIG